MQFAVRVWLVVTHSLVSCMGSCPKGSSRCSRNVHRAAGQMLVCRWQRLRVWEMLYLQIKFMWCFHDILCKNKAKAKTPQKPTNQTNNPSSNSTEKHEASDLCEQVLEFSGTLDQFQEEIYSIILGILYKRTCVSDTLNFFLFFLKGRFLCCTRRPITGAFQGRNLLLFERVIPLPSHVTLVCLVQKSCTDTSFPTVWCNLPFHLSVSCSPTETLRKDLLFDSGSKLSSFLYDRKMQANRNLRRKFSWAYWFWPHWWK